MQNIEKQTEFLLSAALRKCGKTEDAQDLTQETLLSALQFIQNGGYIDDLRGWLLTVMNRKFCAMLRRKYRQPLVSIGDDFDIPDDTELSEAFASSDEAERVRREVAFLSSIYREVVIRHYMDGQSVALIARSLGIPEGTVKSRLSSGRKHMKEGIDKMENYGKNSYEPVKLRLSNSGCGGMGGEPQSLVDGDLIAQNILFSAYEKPLTEADIAKSIGIPTAYIEPVVKRLVDGDLMKRIGDRVYTDFIIFTKNDYEKYIPAQNEFVADNFESIRRPFDTLFEALRKTDSYAGMSEAERGALELFCFFNVFDYSSFRAFSSAFETEQIIPERPNGGYWIAFGHVGKKSDDAGNPSAQKYIYSGQRNIQLDGYLKTKHIRLSVFDPAGFPVRIYYRAENGIDDENLAKLLYIIESGMDFADSGFDEKYLECIPWLAECNILRYENGKPKLNIPVFRDSEIKPVDNIISAAQLALTDSLCAPLKEYLKDKKKEIPPHLKSVPLQKQYMPSYISMLMSALRLAMKKGLIRDGDYDGGNQPPCPMILVINK